MSTVTGQQMAWRVLYGVIAAALAVAVLVVAWFATWWALLPAFLLASWVTPLLEAKYGDRLRTALTRR